MGPEETAGQPTDPQQTAPGRPREAAANGYRVLARKYRPGTFSELIGQDALVRTLTNAIGSGRLAHAFIFTGVRGVGKTTTARILARALNCVDEGRTTPTPDPCGRCEPCLAIAADRHVDVLEMDAASRTGVDDIRELIDGVRYAPVSARFKVYIIDEVHMLSRNAFNALLKTLEEPPPHTKFIFATTEIRKVPVTVLSRCQRFDLPRVSHPELVQHFSTLVETEGAKAEPDAISLIARAADGSVRDGLSLLDQAIALASAGGETASVTVDSVRDMLGLADRTQVVDLFESAVTGDAVGALNGLASMLRAGADPLVILQDLLDVTHGLTRMSVVPATADSPELSDVERLRGADLAGRLSVPILTRTWQILLKGLGEVQAAPRPGAALEMVLIRLVHGAGLPTPEDVIRRLESAETGPQNQGPGRSGDRGAGPAGELSRAADSDAGSAMPARSAPVRDGAMAKARPQPASVPAPNPVPASVSDPEPAPQGAGMPKDFPGLVALFESHGDARLYSELYVNVHLVHYRPGRLEIRPRENAPANLAQDVMARLQDWTGQRWVVSVSGAPGQPTLRQQEQSDKEQALRSAELDPLVQAILATFPGAKVKDIHHMAGVEAMTRSEMAGDAGDGSPDASFETDPEGNGDFGLGWVEADETGDE